MKTIKFNFNGTEVVITLNESGKVHICSHWELIDALSDAGFLTCEGTKADFHHREYRLPQGLAACVESGLDSFEMTGGQVSTRESWRKEKPKDYYYRFQNSQSFSIVRHL